MVILNSNFSGEEHKDTCIDTRYIQYILYSSWGLDYVEIIVQEIGRFKILW